MEVEKIVCAVPFDEQFLASSWEWLRDPEVEHLTMTPPFTREQQRIWFEHLSNRSDYLIWGIASGGEPIGAFGIKAIRDRIGEYWGYIGVKDYWGRGIGRYMMQYALDAARELGLERLELRVLKENERAIRLYRNFAFRERLNTDEYHPTVWMERDIQ